MLYLSLLPLLLAYGLACSAHPLEIRQSARPFKIYAYGKGISGLPVLYRNGLAEVADISKVDTAAMTSVEFTFSADSSNTWMVYPSSTERSAPFSTNMLCLEQGNSAANQVSFSGTSENERSTKLSNVWSLYGGYVLVTVRGANFYAKSTGTDGLYSLFWSTSAEDMTDTIPLTLRITEPATMTVLT